MSTEPQSTSKEMTQAHVNNSPEDNGWEGSNLNEDEVLMAGELANNDGSVVETLDTAFHNFPGYIKDHSLAGSNRADYYEARSQGKSDDEEELEVLRKQQIDKEKQE